jgi:GNAT superfamily N-acetyltransferase
MNITFKIAGPSVLADVARNPNIAPRMLELTNPDVVIEGESIRMSAFRRWITEARPGFAFFALDYDTHQIVGQGLVLDEAPHYRFGVFVDPRYRRRQLGTLLHLAAKVEFGDALFVSPRSERNDGGASLRFYKKLGYCF